MELQNIQETCQAAKRRKVKLTSLEHEINSDHESWFERANIHLERLLEKANKKNTLLRHMAYHYMARNKVCKARIRSSKEKLKRESRRWKEQDTLQILAKAYLAQHCTWWRRLSQNFKKIGTTFAFLKFLGRNTNFSALCATPPGARFLWELQNDKNLAFLDLAWKNILSYQWPRNVDRFWAPKWSKTPKERPYCPYFDT